VDGWLVERRKGVYCWMALYCRRLSCDLSLVLGLGARERKEVVTLLGALSKKRVIFLCGRDGKAFFVLCAFFDVYVSCRDLVTFSGLGGCHKGHIVFFDPFFKSFHPFTRAELK